ncbi:MAG: VWA domain-containing protein [Acidobacteriota bacterium]
MTPALPVIRPRRPLARRSSRLLAAAALGWLVGAAAAGAESADVEPPAFDDKTAVTLIEVPVNVVDRAGAPIRGLTAQDFALFDDGDRQDIKGFEVVDLATLRPTRAETERAVAQLPAAARRHFLLLFDLSFARPTSLVKARQAARRFVLEHLHPADLAAVATFSLGHGPQLLVTFTPDRAQLARAVETLGAPGLIRRGQVADPLRFVIDAPLPGERIDDGGLGQSAGDVEGAVARHLSVVAFQRESARQAFERSRISGWSRAMAEMATSLAAIDGRKHVVYFSEGFDGSLLLGRDASRDAEAAGADQRLREAGKLWLVDPDNTFGNRALQNDVADMLEAFRRADCVIQAVDVAGLRVETSVDGTDGERTRGRAGDAKDALFYIADATGGHLFENTNDLGRQLEDVLGRNTVTYVLSFYPRQLDFDGAYHRLRVKADLPRGARLSHRPGYFAPRRFQELHPLEKTLLASQSIAAATPRRDFDIAVLAAPFRASPGLSYVPVIVEIDGRSLLAAQTAGTLGVEIYIYATDARGEVRDFVTQLVSYDLRGSRSTLADGGVKYYGHLDLVPGRYRLRVLVRNADTGKTAVARQDLEVPDYGKAMPEALPPLFLEPPDQWLMAREPTEEDDGAVAYPFVLKGEPYVPSARPVVRRGERARFSLVAYHLGEGPLELEARVSSDRGPVSAAGELTLIERTVTGAAGVDKLLASFDPSGLDVGDYTFEVMVRHAESGAEALGMIPLRVE